MPRRPARVIKALVQGFFKLHPEEASQMLDRLPVREIVRLLEAEPVLRAASLIERMTPEIAARVVQEMSDDFVRPLLGSLDPDRAASLLAQLDEGIRSQKLALLDPSAANTIRLIMTYPSDSAGQLMDPRVMTFRPDATVREILARLRHPGRKRIHDIFVIDSEGHLLGAVPIQEVAISPPAERASALYRETPISVNALATKEDVVDLMGRLKLASLPVVDFEGRILGVIRHDALVTAAQEEVSADLQTMVGVSKEERALSKVTFVVRKRLPWLQINLATAFLAAAVVGIFEGTIAQFTALAVLLPVVAGQSGNTGAQALAVTMRGLSLREIRVGHWPRVFFKEIKAGVLNGAAVAVTTSFFVFLWSQSVGLALVIGLAMVISMAVAGLSGAAIPILLTVSGQDPAQSSSIILTTVTDVVGFLSFLGIATLMAGIL